jgi:hypothetical protein
MIPKEHAAEIQKLQTQSLRDDISHLYAGLLASGREDEADKVAAVLTDALDDSASRRALVAMALDASQPRERHFKLLDEADSKEPASSGESDVLRAHIKKALKVAGADAAKK